MTFFFLLSYDMSSLFSQKNSKIYALEIRILSGKILNDTFSVNPDPAE